MQVLHLGASGSVRRGQVYLMSTSVGIPGTGEQALSWASGGTGEEEFAEQRGHWGLSAVWGAHGGLHRPLTVRPPQTMWCVRRSVSTPCWP